MNTLTAVDMVVICYLKTKNIMRDEEEMEDEERALTTSEYGVAFPAFSSLPFTTELANESNSGVMGEIIITHLRPWHGHSQLGSLQLVHVITATSAPHVLQVRRVFSNCVWTRLGLGIISATVIR
jgi:hypothetical protein